VYSPKVFFKKSIIKGINKRVLIIRMTRVPFEIVPQTLVSLVLEIFRKIYCVYVIQFYKAENGIQVPGI
jgi:hypothetical protein